MLSDPRPDLPVRLVLGLAALAWLLPGAVAGVRPGALIWNDEFHQEPGTPPDPEKWVYDLGGGGWGNQELETYVSDPANCQVVRDELANDGYALAIRAIRTSHGITSARIKTKGLQSFIYGHFEARLRLTRGQGVWPAFWLLGDRVGQVGWPAGGEIDIMENIGSRPSNVYGTLHGPGYSGDHGIQQMHPLPGGVPYSRGYHIFAVDWAKDSITWSVDGQAYQTLTPASLPKGTKWVYNDAPFHLILNLAIGGGWPGNPDATTALPQTLFVDYVRVRALPKGSATH